MACGIGRTALGKLGVTPSLPLQPAGARGAEAVAWGAPLAVERQSR